jgi:hypothetical protein
MIDSPLSALYKTAVFGGKNYIRHASLLLRQRKVGYDMDKAN